MPFITVTEYEELLQFRKSAEDVRPHVLPWIDLLTDHVRSLPQDRPETPEDAGSSERSYAEHELRAMCRDLGALLSI